MDPTLLASVRAAENLPSLPTVAVEVLRLSRREDVSVDDLVRAIQNDPVLSARLLKVVNSAFFGLPRSVSSLSQTVSLLGVRSVKVMALSFSLVDTLQKTQGQGFDFPTYWGRSLNSAVAAQRIAAAVQPRLAEEAFVSGLLCDIGMVAIWRCAPEEYQELQCAWQASGHPLPVVEMAQLGFTHARASQELLQSWGLPALICDAIGAHHGQGLTDLADEPRELAGIVHAAASIADLFTRGIPSSELERVKRDCIAQTRIGAAQLEALLADIDQHVRNTAAMLSLEVCETINYAQVQAAAASQLAQLSMMAEVERVQSAKCAQEARQEASRLHEEKKAILEVASTDGLTHVANRAAFDQRLDEELKRAGADGRSLGLIMLDVDHFKRFNDRHGHQAGDEVLRGVARCLKETLRDLGFVARYGGEEFAVILADKTSQAIRAMAEEIRVAIADCRVRHEGKELQVTASLGGVFAGAPINGLTSAQLVKQADQQLYHAKHAGRNRVEMAPVPAATCRARTA